MERGAALTKIRKILGSKFNYRVDPKAPTKEERAEAKGELVRMNEKVSELEKRVQTRRRELLDGDDQYKTLDTAYRAARDLRDKTRGKLYHHKFSVGVATGMFNFIKAEGDSWEEVIEKLQGDKKRATKHIAKVTETTDIPNSEIFGMK